MCWVPCEVLRTQSWIQELHCGRAGWWAVEPVLISYALRSCTSGEQVCLICGCQGEVHSLAQSGHTDFTWFVLEMCRGDQSRSLRSLCSSPEHNTPCSRFKGAVLYLGSCFQPMGTQLSGRNRMTEGCSRTKLITPWQSRAESKGRRPCHLPVPSTVPAFSQRVSYKGQSD